MIVVAAATKRVGVGGMVEKIWVVVVVGRIIMYNIGGSAINEGVHRFVECVCVCVCIYCWACSESRTSIRGKEPFRTGNV